MSYFRHPQTKNEMWQYYASMVYKLDIPIRHKRAPHYLPSAWSDISRPRYRSWKFYRKTQWKIKSIF